MINPHKTEINGVGVLKVHKINITRHIPDRNAIPLMFQAIVQKGAPPQYIKYDDLKKRYPQILFSFLEEKIKINKISQNIHQLTTQANKGYDKIRYNQQYQQEISNQSQLRSEHSTSQQNSESQWTTGNTRKSQSRTNRSRGRLQVRITSNRSSKTYQPNMIRHKRFAKQDGTYVKTYHNQKQRENLSNKDCDFQHLNRYMKIVGNGIQYDEAYIKLKYEYDGVYDRIITKGILHTKNVHPKVKQAQMLKQSKPKKSKSKSKSKNKSRTKSKLKRHKISRE